VARARLDEGPIFQSQRSERHREALEQLLEGGHAYHSTATADDVRDFKARHGDDRGFRGEEQAAGAVRLRVPDTGETIVDDVIRGRTAFPNVSMDDPVIARADGSALYNFAVAIDDLDAGITHVVRGEDHLSNTPSSCWCSGRWEPRRRFTPTCRCCTAPTVASCPSDTAPRRCRSCATPATCRRRSTTTSPCWAPASPPTEEHFTLAELAERFRLERVSKNPAVFDERKLRHVNGRHLRELGTEELTRRLEEFTGRSGLRGASRSRPRRSRPWRTSGPWCRSCSTARSMTRRRLRRRSVKAAARRPWPRPGTPLITAEPFTPETIEAALRGVVEAGEGKPGKVFQPVRVALAGQTVSPGIFETLALLGREESLARIDRA